MARYSVLIVDDEPGIRESLTGVLQDEGYVVDAVESGEACLDFLAHHNCDVMLLDIWLPGMDGIQALEKIQALDSPPIVIMISGHGTIDAAVRSTKLGAFDFIEKPLSIDKTLLTLKHAAEQLTLATQNRQLREELQGQYRIIGESVPMKALRQQLALAAPTHGRVLIFGESGTGKELVAHALHLLSLRAQQPFVEVNCAAIPEELIESELFGHVKGSFTGAVEDKVGKFEQAHGGTLFLDEVGDMSLRTQSKVLRVIEEQRFTPVGSGNNLTVDVRGIAATNKNLAEEIQKGNFREDLFYRLNVIPFFVPPLRDHGEDIPALANYFLAEFAHAYGRRPKHFSESALEVVLGYRWPGNVRELMNCIEAMVVTTRGDVLDVADIPPHISSAPASARSGMDIPPGLSMDEVEKIYIQRTLELTKGNREEAARILKIGERTLYRKLEKYGLK
jgi:two-component system nitrogen regulation response regulator NtrX